MTCPELGDVLAIVMLLGVVCVTVGAWLVKR